MSTIDLNYLPKNTNDVKVMWFGVVGDGVTDDTAAVINAHTFANTLDLPVSYEGINTIALQANAQIPLKTSTDFHNCLVIILGGVTSTPSSSFSGKNTLYKVTDDSTPLVNLSAGTIDPADLTAGSLYPTRGLFDGHGYALLSCAYQVSNRDMTGTQNYTQSFKVNRFGKASQPLSIDLSAYSSAITISYRLTSKKRLKISNFNLLETGWNNEVVFKIERSNVQIDCIHVGFIPPGTAYNNKCDIFALISVSDVSISNFVTTGRPVTLGNGSYDISVYGGADIYIDKMNALTGWGCTGTNDINGLYITRSVINRVDCHSSGHNIHVYNCDLHEYGVLLGWGGGVISVKNSRLHGCPAIKYRNDYGGSIFGHFIVDSCEIDDNQLATYRLIDYDWTPPGASIPIYMPTTISVNNCKRVKQFADNSEFIPVAIRIKDATSVVYAPASIDVSNITSLAKWRFGLRLDLLNMEQALNTTNTLISFSNINPDIPGTSTTGILDFTNIKTVTNPIKPIFKGSDSTNIHIKCLSTSGLEILLSNVEVNGIYTDTTSSEQPYVHLKSCRLKSAASGYTNAPIGGGVSGITGHTVLNGCEIENSNFDLSKVAAFSNNILRSGATSPILPVSVTPDMLFTGWRKGSTFYGNNRSSMSVFAQFSMPIGILSSCTIGNNGSISGVTALNVTYPGVWTYWSANTFNSNIAGFYWTVMSSTTAGTVYNNMLDISNPVRPTTLVPFTSVGIGAYTQTNSSIAFIQKTLPGNYFGANNIIQTTCHMQCNNSSGTKNIRTYIDSTQIALCQTTTSLGLATQTMFFANGTTGEQGTTRIASSMSGSYTSSPPPRLSFDMSTDKTLYNYLQLGTVTDSMVCEHIVHVIM